MHPSPPGEDIVGKVIVKAEVNLKVGQFGLDHLNQLAGVVHAGDGVLHAHDVAVQLSQLDHGVGRDGVSGVGGEIVDIDGAVDGAGQMVVVLEQSLIVKVEIVGGGS